MSERSSDRGTKDPLREGAQTGEEYGRRELNAEKHLSCCVERKQWKQSSAERRTAEPGLVFASPGSVRGGSQ